MINRGELRALLESVGIPQLPPKQREENEGDVYSQAIYSCLETIAAQHEIYSATELLAILRKRCQTPAYQFVLQTDMNPITRTTHRAYFLDYPHVGYAQFFLTPTASLERDILPVMEQLLYQIHECFMVIRAPIAPPQQHTGYYHSPNSSLWLCNPGDIYALKIAAYNETLDNEERPPKDRPDGGIYQ